MKISTDVLSAPMRHAIVAGIGAAGFVIIQAIRAYNGVIGVGLPWHDTLVSSLNAGFMAGLTGVAVMAVTPLTQQYGAFKGQQPVQTNNGPTDMDPDQGLEIPPLNLNDITD